MQATGLGRGDQSGFSWVPISHALSHKQIGPGKGATSSDGEGGMTRAVPALAPAGSPLTRRFKSVPDRFVEPMGSHPAPPPPHQKKPHDGAFLDMAEGVGFEPTKGYKPLLVFKTSAFNRSATPPGAAAAPLVRRELCVPAIRHATARPTRTARAGVPVGIESAGTGRISRV